MKIDKMQPPLPSEVSDRVRALEAETRALENEMRRKIFTDTKTPLQNAEAFEALWPQFIGYAPVHLLFVEMDEMKRLNNEFGHDNADLFLLELGSILSGFVSEQIYAFHMSGDEFFLVTCNLFSSKVSELAERILQQTRLCRVLLENTAESFTVSIGIAEVDVREESGPAQALAEKAMMEAKRGGRNQYVWFSPEVEKRKPRIDVRKDCPQCQTHFSFSVDEEIYRKQEEFFCPVCGVTTRR